MKYLLGINAIAVSVAEITAFTLLNIKKYKIRIIPTTNFIVYLVSCSYSGEFSLRHFPFGVKSATK